MRLRDWFTRALITIVTLLAIWLPRLALPLASTSCACGERGSPVVFDAATVERNPTIVVEGPACEAKSVQCVHRDGKDRCDTFWIVPEREGHCLFSVRFPDDGTWIEDNIDYDVDEDYPCRGNIRPRTDGHVTRITSAPRTAP